MPPENLALRPPAPFSPRKIARTALPHPALLVVLCTGWTATVLAQDLDESAPQEPSNQDAAAQDAAATGEPWPAAQAPDAGEVKAATTPPTDSDVHGPPPVDTEPTAPGAPSEEAPLDGLESAPPEAEPPEEPFSPRFTIGAGMRTGLRYTLNGPRESELRLDDGLVDQANVRPFMAGQLTPQVGYFVQFEIGTPNGLGSFAILDAIAQLKFLDELQLWVGQHIPANDRNNMNGPFFGNGWNFAIAVEEYPFDVGARDRGATVWGLISGGTLKYHLSVVDLQPGQQASNARVSGRLTLHLLEPEDFYYNSGTYWGSKDVLALGAVFHSQQGVDLPPATDPTEPPPNRDNDLFGYSFDLLFEKNLEKAGTVTVEGGYWNFEGTGNGYVVNQGTVDQGLGVAGPYPGTAYMGVVSWLTPEKIGVGHLQPNFRVQYAEWEPETRFVFDAGLAYVVDGFNHKYHFNYRRQETEPAGGGESVSADMIQLGVQYLMSN